MKKIICVFMCIMLIVPCLFSGLNVKAAEPKVMVTDYTLNPDKVVAGEDFKLTIKLKNTASRKVRNMKLTVMSEAGELLPAEGAGTEYISEMKAEEEQEIIFDMTAVSGLSEKSYKLTIKCEYEDTNGYSYTVEDNIYIPVSLEQRISVTDVMSDASVKLGDDVEITARVNNIGEGTLYNVTIKVQGDNIEEQTTYIGNIESGKSGNADILARTSHATEYGRYNKNYMIVTYEDRQKNKHEQQQEISLNIEATNYSDLEVLKEPEEKSISTEIIVAIIAAVAVALVIVLSVLKWKRKKKILEEF